MRIKVYVSLFPNYGGIMAEKYERLGREKEML